MKVTIRYHEIFKESLEEELEWLKDEFEILFKSKIGHYNKKEKKIANDIFDYMLENTMAYDNIILYNLFFDAMENIEKIYPELF